MKPPRSQRPEKRVLYISHGHPDYSAGGGEWAAHYMYSAMLRSVQFQPYLLARFEDPDGRCAHAGTRLLRHDTEPATHLIISNRTDHFFHTKLDTEPLIYEDFREFLEALKPDIVHFHHYVHLGVDLIGYVRRLLPKAPILLTLHEYMAMCANQGSMIKTGSQQLCYRATPTDCSACFPDRRPSQFFLRDHFIRSNLREVDLFLAPSKFLRQRYIEWGIAAKRIVFQEYGRPIWPPRKESARRPAEPFRVAFFGQVVFHKGWDVFLKSALEYLRLRARRGSDQVPPIQFLFHGVRKWLTAEDTQRLEALLASTAEVVYDHGAYHARQMPSLLRNVDCVVIPSKWWENSPLVIQEAFMAGVPVICSDIGGMAEKVTHRVNGLHFSIGNHFDLLQKILELASTPKLYQRLQRGIPKIFSDTEMVAELHDIYARLLRNSSRRVGV